MKGSRNRLALGPPSLGPALVATALIVGALMSGGLTQPGFGQGAAIASPPGKNIEVNGVSLYVEEHGQGIPLVLVHGGTVSSASWAPLIPLLAERFRVIVFDTRGHGRSTNPSGELTYQLIADDTAALIDALGLERPVVGGWSDGGQVALELDLRHPGVARALIAGGVMHDFQGEEFRSTLQALFTLDEEGAMDFGAMAEQQAGFVALIESMHPAPGQWQTVLQLTARMWSDYPSLTAEKLASVKAPVLVISGDRDGMIPLEHTLDIHQWLSGSELAILPGLDHMGVIQQPSMFAQVVGDYILRH